MQGFEEMRDSLLFGVNVSVTGKASLQEIKLVAVLEANLNLDR